MLKGRACRVDLASSKGGESRLGAVNWREGHNVVDRAPRSESMLSRGAPSPITQGNWRETAKPVEAAPLKESAHSPATQPFRSASTTTKKPELKLLPRTAPVVSDPTYQYKKSIKPNPFGEAKPRELVLAEKNPNVVETSEKQT